MKGLLRARLLPLDGPSAKTGCEFRLAIQGKTPTGLKTHLRLSAVGGFCVGSLSEREYILEPPKATPKTRLKNGN